MFKPGYSWPSERSIEPLGDLPSIRHLSVPGWQPPPDAAWLVSLKELILSLSSGPNMELVQALSACTNLEELTIVSEGNARRDLPVATPPITLARLRSMRLEFASNQSAAILIRRLIIPQCLRSSLQIHDAKHLPEYVADYRRLMSPEGNCTHYPESGYIAIKRSNPYSWNESLDYETNSHRLSFKTATAVE
ncbi:hypothetical protein FRC01_006648, partial [Tulasnella sp. 417]